MSSFKDLVKKVNNGEYNATSGQKQLPGKDEEEKKSSSFKDLVRNVNDGTIKVSSSLRSDDVTKWYTSVNQTGKKAYEYLTKEGYKTPDAATKSDIDKHLSQAAYVGQYLRANRSSLSNYDELMQNYHDTVSYLRDLQKGFESSDKHYSQWKTKEDYDFWEARNTTEKRQQLYTDTQARIEELEAFYDEAYTVETWYNSYKMNPGAWDQETVNRNLSIYNKLKSQFGSLSDLDAEIDRLKTDNRNYERGNSNERGQHYGSKVVDDYYNVTQNPDFAEGSANREYVNPTKEEFELLDVMNDSSTWKFGTDGVYRDAFGNELAVDDKHTYYNPAAQQYQVTDKLGLYLSASEDERVEAIYSAEYDGGAWEAYMTEGYAGAWEYLTKQEQEIYYYLLGESPDTADKYLSDMKTELNRRKTLANIGKWSEAYDEASFLEQIAMNIATVPAQLTSGLTGTIENTVATLKGEEINPYSEAHSGMHYSQTVRGKTAEDWNATGLKLPVVNFTLGDLYQSGMSILDSFAAIGIGGSLGGALLATNAASSEATRLYEQGASMGQIAVGSVAAGAAEMVFESLSIDKLINLKDAKTAGQFVKNLLVQGGIEASEEGFTEIANILTNAIVMGNQSDWAKLIEENGGDAWKAFLSEVQAVAHASLAGFFSGVGSATIPSAVSYGATQAQYAKTGKDIADSVGGVDALKKLANEVAGVSDAKMQKSLNKQISSLDKKASNRKAGKLYEAVGNSINAQNKADIVTILEMNRFGSEEANSIADAIVALASGEQLTSQQEKTLYEYKDSTHVKDIIKNYNYDDSHSIGKRNKALAEIENGVAISLMAKEYTEKAFTPEGKYKVSDTGEATALVTEVDVDGKTITKDTGEVIDIKGIKEISRGKMILDIGDGKTIDAKNVAYASKKDALIYEAIASLGDNIDPATADKLIGKFDGGNAMVFARGITQAYTYGFYGLDRSEMKGKHTLSAGLTEAQRNYAYGLGQQYRPVKDAKDKTEAKVTKAPGEKGVYYRDKNGNATDIRSYLKETEIGLKDVQKTAIEAMEKMSEMMGVRFNVFESWVENGKRYYLDENGVKTEGSPNGFYDTATGEIYIDLNAGNDYQGTMLFTVAHELTHFMRQWSPEHFTKIAQLVFQHGGMKGSVAKLAARKQAIAKAKGKPISYDTALEEVVADGMETILKDGKVLEFMEDVKKTDHEAWAKLKEWFKKLADFLKELVEAYSSHSAQTVEGAKVAEFAEDLLNQIKQIWAEGAVVGGATYQMAIGNVKVNNQITMKEDVIDSSNKGIAKENKTGIKMQERTEYESMPKQVFSVSTTNGEADSDMLGTNKSVKELRDARFKENGFSDKEISTINGFIKEMADNMAKYRLKYKFVGLQNIHDAKIILNPMTGKIVLSAMVNNSDYSVNFDFTKICKKRVALQEVLETLAREKGKVTDGKVTEVNLTPANIKHINDILASYGVETACLCCFVESKRYNIQNYYQEKVVDVWNMLVDEVSTDAGYFNFADSDVDTSKVPDSEFAELEAQMKEWAGKTGKAKDVEQKMREFLADSPAARKKLRFSDLVTANGRTNLHKLYPEIESLILSKLGQSAPKSVEAFTPYNGEIDLLEAKSNGDIVKYLYSIAGVRSQSFSDFMIAHVFDVLQKTASMSARKMPAHVYTKEIARAMLFGMTGEKHNLSVLHNVDPDVDSWNAGLSAKGEYNFSDYEAYKKGYSEFVQSIGWKDAVALQNTEGYSKDCGIIGVGFSYNHMLKLHNDPEVRQVIGYHTSQMPVEVKPLTHLDKATDYTSVQNTKAFVGFAKPNYAIPEGVPSYATPPQDVMPKGNKKKTPKTTVVSDTFDIVGTFNNLSKGKTGEARTAAAKETLRQLLEYANDHGYVLRIASGEKGHGDFALYEDVQKTQNPYLTADHYIEYCIERGMLPMFFEFSMNPNYYKDIFDFNVFDRKSYNPETGLHEDSEGRKAYAPQTAVHMLNEDGSLAFPDNFFDIVDKQMSNYNIYMQDVDSKMPSIMEEVRAVTNSTSKLSDRDSDKSTLATEGTVKYSDNRFFPGNVFPSGLTHTSVAEWANRKDVKTGDNRLVYHRGAYYQVEKFDDMDFKYLITKKYDTGDFEEVLKEYEENNSKKSPKSEFDEGVTRYRETVGYGQDGYHADPSGAGYRGENGSVHGVVSYEDGGRGNSGRTERDRTSGLRDQQETGQESLEYSPQELYDKMLDLYRALVHATGSYATKLKNQRERYASMIDDMKGWDQVRYSDRDNGPTFYSQMAKVVDGVKQEKLGAASVVSMLRGKGVKAEEIKWSGIEDWLEGKKSVTKAELQEFIAGSMLQIEEEVLDNKDRPYTEDQQKRLDEYEAKRDEVAKRLADEWKKITGEEFPVRNPGAGLESTVVNKIIDANKEHKDAAFEGRLLKKLRNDLKEVIENNDDFGFDSWRDALRSIHRHRRDFIKGYEMSTNDKAIIVKYCNALNAYNELPNRISDEDADRLRAIARETDPWTRKIMEVKHEHNEDEAKYMTNWREYSLKGGKNYREMLFRIPGSAYTNEAMMTHWKERKGVLAHARVQDMDTFIGKMLFIEEIQSDWHNAGRKDGYRDPGAEDKYTLTKKMEKFREEFFESPTAKMFEERISAVGYEGAGVSMMLNYLLDETDYTLDVLNRKGVSFTDSQKSDIDKYVREYGEMNKQWENAPGELTAPDAPFKETYHEYVLKRLIREAAEQDYDSIGWTTAETQDDRWQNNLPHKEGTGKSGFLKAYTIEYDQNIRNFMAKFGKKWGTTVGKTVLDNGTEVWAMAITDSMKESVMTEGQALYSDRDYVAYDSTAILKEETVDRWLRAYATKSSPSYAQAYIAYMKPDQFLELTTSDYVARKHIESESYELDEEKFVKATSDQPLFLDIDHETGEVYGHEGRHRCVALQNAGIESVPVLLFDTSNKYSKEDIPSMLLKGQFNKYHREFVFDAIPLSYENQDRVIQNFATQSSAQRFWEKTGTKNTLRFQDRDEGSVSNRSLLANAFEGLAKDDTERNKIQEYKSKIALIETEEKNLRELNEQIKELSFAKGPRDTKKINALRFDANQAANRINTYDKQLLRLEASKPLQDVLNREKRRAYKKAEERGKEALAEYKAKVEAQQKETTEKWRESRKTAVAKARETAEKRDARAKLQKLVLDTVNWITYPAKTDVKCPDILKKPYADFLNGIDLSSKRQANGGDPTKNDLRLANAMGSLATALDKIMISQDPTQDVDKVLDTGYLDLPADFVQKLRDMTESIKSMMVEGDYVVNNMTASEVRQLSQMIRTLNHAIKTMSNLYANLRFANVEALGFDTMEFMDALGEIEKTSGMKDFVQWDNALPYYAFKRFGKGGESVFEGLMDAQDKLAFLAQEIFNFRDKAWTNKEAKAWSEDTHTIELPNGSTLTLTTADAMSIYCLSRREQGLQHLLGGGTRVMGIQKGSQKAKDSRSLLTIKDIDAINSSLTDRQKQVADGIQEFMSSVCSEWGNEISMRRFLTKEFTEKFYFPIESNDENLTVKDPAAQQSDLFRLLNISATKPLTPGANNEVIIRNIFDVFTGHASDMARLNAYGMALLDYMKWLNYREKGVNEEGQINVKGVRKSMEKAYGKAANSYVLNLVKDVNGRPSDGGLPSFYTKMLRSAKTAMVGNSLRVATLQITSYPRAALVLSPKSLALGLSKLPNIERAKKYCGIALWKSFGFYDTNISRSIEDQMKGVKDVRQKLIELSLKGAELGDAITWGALWNACEYEVAQTTKNKVGSEEFYQEVGKKLREVVYRTQVVDSTLTRSEIMRSKNSQAQAASAFMSEPTLSANILMDAGFEFNMEKRRTGNAKQAWQKTGKYIGRAIAVYGIGQLAAALMEGLWDAWRDDEDEEFGNKFADAFTENLILDLLPFNKIPILSEFAEAALSLMDLGYFSSDNLYSTGLMQTVSAVDAWKDVLSGNSSTTVYNALYKSVRAVSSFYGVSVSGVMREGVALWNNTAGAYDSTLKIRQYDLSNANLGAELYEAIISGNTRQADSLKAQFENADAMHSAVRKALRENDPRIKEAATADYIDKNPSERVRIAKLIIADGFDQDDVVMAINAVIADMKPDEPDDDPKAKGLYSAANFAREIANGDQASAYAAKADIIATAQKNGKSEEKAMESFVSSAKTELKKLFKAGEVSETQVVKALITFCDIEEEDAQKYAGGVAFEIEHPELDGIITYTQYQRWETDGKPNGVSLELFTEVAGFRDDGTSNSVKSQDEVALYISSVTSDRNLRHALWCCFYKATTSPWR